MHRNIPSRCNFKQLKGISYSLQCLLRSLTPLQRSNHHEWDILWLLTLSCFIFTIFFYTIMMRASLLTHIRLVMQTLVNHKLFAKPSKFYFMVSKVNYHSHIISEACVEFDLDKFQAIMKWLIMNQTIQIPTQRWLTKLLGYDFEIFYFSGHGNVVVDGLSRCQPVGHLFAAISTYQPIIITELQNFYVSHLVVTVFASNFSIPNNCLFSSKWFCMTKIRF